GERAVAANDSGVVGAVDRAIKRARFAVVDEAGIAHKLWDDLTRRQQQRPVGIAVERKVAEKRCSDGVRVAEENLVCSAPRDGRALPVDDESAAARRVGGEIRE